MDVKTKDRFESAKLAARYLASPAMRDQFRDAPHLLNNPVVVCEWETLANEVEEMVIRAQRNVEEKETLIIIRRDDSLSVLSASDSSFPISGDSIPSDQVHDDAYIGHVYEALLPRKKWTITDGMLQEVKPTSVVRNNFEFALA